MQSSSRSLEVDVRLNRRADPLVKEHFPSALSRVESDAFADRIDAGSIALGYGLWAIERDRLCSRLLCAMAVAKARGVRLGRPRSIELAVERRILCRRHAGASLQKIADELTAAKVATPNGGPAWSWGTVLRVVRRNLQEPIRPRKPR